MNNVVSQLCANFNPQSIILTGSFGRGEITVINQNGNFKFLSDCELLLIPYQFLKGQLIKNIQKQLYNATGLKIEIWGGTLTLFLYVKSLLHLKPTISNYDLKYGSRVVYGKNYLDKIFPYKQEDIPLWEGLRLLFNRMIEALDYYSHEDTTIEMIYWTDKIVFACQDALLLTLGIYFSSYRERNKIFLELFPNHFEDISKQVKILPNMASEALKRKLTGDFQSCKDPVKYWHDVVEVCDVVFRYIIKKGLGMVFLDYIDFQNKYLHIFQSKQHPFFIHAHERESIYQNIWYIIKQLLFHYRIASLNFISRLNFAWSHIVYSTIPLVYFNTLKKNCLNKKYITRLRYVISLLDEKISQNYNLYESHNTVNSILIEYWRELC